MKIKELQKTVNIAWSPAQQQQILLAAGTAAQQFDSNANSTLELYSPNFSDATYDLELKASVASQYKWVCRGTALKSSFLKRLFLRQVPKTHLEPCGITSQWPDCGRLRGGADQHILS